MLENLMENQKKMFEMWQDFFKKSEPEKQENIFSLPSDLANPFFKMNKSTDIFKDFYSFYENFQKSFLKPNETYDFADFQKLFAKFQENYSNIIFKIMGIDEITPIKIFDNFTKQFGGLDLFAPIKNVLDTGDISKWFESFSNANYGTFENFLKMPSFWVTREINDLIKEVINNLLEYNKKIQEFKDVMSKQNKKGFELFLEEVKKQPQSNDFDSFFKKWINSNDEIFQDFFKSKEYGELLKNLIKSGAKLRSSLDKYTQQVLKESNIATKHELDRAYKEIYQLKKELKSIKSKLSDLEGNIITLKKEVNK
jgi:class III poly(R)-hydroxyalkanoic acid synthase PhaE subunit